jgi:hypothetical protein
MKTIFNNILLTLSVVALVAIGVNAQTLNETLGSGSGSSITTGDYNAFLGDSAGATNSYALRFYDGGPDIDPIIITTHNVRCIRQD